MNVLARTFKKLFQSEVKVGDTAPDFLLPDQNGTPVQLSSFRAKNKCVVLYFYPKDDTYGCIAESCGFRDQYSIFRENGAEVIGVSSDSPDSHSRFATKYSLPFTLLSDQKNEIRKLYGVPSTMGLIPGRVSYLIDNKGIVRSVFNSQFNPTSHVDQALAIIRQCGSC